MQAAAHRIRSRAISAHAWRLIAIMAVAVLLRLCVMVPALLHPERSLRADSEGYLVLAESIASGQGLSFDAGGHRAPSVARTPVYSAMLAAIGAKRDGYGQTLPLQLLLDLAVLAMVYVAAREACGTRAALLAATGYAVGISSAVSSAFIMTDTLFTLFVAGQMLFGLRYARRGALVDGVASGALLALAMLTRPIGVVLLPLHVLLVAIGMRRSRSAWRHGLACLAVLVAIVGPWLVRNERITGEYILSSMGDYNLLAYNAAAVEANVRGVSEDDVRRELVDTYMASADSARDWSGLKKARRAAFEIIGRHPGRYAALHLKDSALNLLPDVSGLLEIWGVTTGARGTKAVIHSEGLLRGARHYLQGKWGAAITVAPWGLVSLLVWVLGLAGVFGFVKTGRMVVAAACVLAVAALVLAPGPASHPRFGVPALPWVAFASAGCLCWFDRRRADRTA